MKISIITVCYNSEKTIEDTIKSVLMQSYENYEYLIIDGNSSDLTLNIINSYLPLFNGKLKCISEKDNGIYDAMNKGISLSNGNIIGILNSDDILASNNVLQMVVDNWSPDTDVVYANVKYCNDDFSVTVRNYISGMKNNDAWCPAHPSMYVSRKTYQRIGLYNLDYKISADYDFMVRCNINNITYKYVNAYFVFMRYGGASNGIKGYINNFVECILILKRNGVKHPFLLTIKRCFLTMKQLFLH